MDNAISSQHHPAVVLRSAHRMRALLAAGIIAAAGLTGALVIAANDDDTGAISASPAGQINNGGFNPATGRPDSAPLPQRDSTSVPEIYVNPSTGYPSTLPNGR